ncbi:MAG: SDR family NAD(P)-dependent oxidoreductase, partial [Porphyrobacter sp.]|nr:SDR family NAD(P)-dependent oxidoreductase [Porphyrobacter sp.]
MPHLFIFGLGYSAKRIKRSLECAGWTVSATGRDAELAFDDQRAVWNALATATHVLSSVPPAGETDPVLDRYSDALGHDWLGYLSSTGVYGDTRGAWVDEGAPTGAGRRSAR